MKKVLIRLGRASLTTRATFVGQVVERESPTLFIYI